MLRSWRGLIKHLALVEYLVINNLKIRHQNMVLGYLWWILNPLLWVLVYWFLVVLIFNRGEPNYPLFLSCAILPWRAFSVSISQSITAVSSQESIIKQVSFPKSVLPISIVLSNSVNLLFSILVLICIALAYGILPTINLGFLPLIIIIQLIFTFGIAFLISIVGVYFVDIKNMMQFILRIWLYLSPSLYSIERIPEKFQTIFMLNPFAPIFMSYRDVIMHGRMPAIGPLFIAFAIAAMTLMLGFWLFSGQEPKLAKMV